MEQLPANAPLEAYAAPDDAVLELLRAWVPAQRWFPAKGERAALERVAVADLLDPLAEATVPVQVQVQVQVHILALPSGRLLQVPTVLRAGAAPADTPGAIGVLGNGAAAMTLVDGPHDPAFVRAWLAIATKDGQVADDVRELQVLAGEQSNTSVILPAGRPAAILKVFRGLTTGANPDVEVPLALSHAGWSGVPRPLAWLAGTWPSGDEARVSGHLGVLTELVTGARDGFRLACDMAAVGADFGALAEDLGRTTAQMHRALRVALPMHEHLPRTPGNRIAEVRQVTEMLRGRATDAATRVPALAARLDAALAVYAALDRLEVVAPLQRVHGDYHLGQVLRSADDRWYVLDFEGEPQASAAEKSRPDLALRDLAGMLRSLDYAASVGSADVGWAASARARLVAGYHSEAGLDPHDPATAVLLRALELDKALYEVVYESGNRPSWVPIPLAAVDRLLDD